MNIFYCLSGSIERERWIVFMPGSEVMKSSTCTSPKKRNSATGESIHSATIVTAPHCSWFKSVVTTEALQINYLKTTHSHLTNGIGSFTRLLLRLKQTHYINNESPQHKRACCCSGMLHLPRASRVKLDSPCSH